MVRHLLRAYLVERLIRGGHRRGYRYGTYARHRPRGRGGLFPFPHYSRRTRRGGRVRVGGCCLPIPLGVLVLTAWAAGRTWRA